MHKWNFFEANSAFPHGFQRSVDPPEPSRRTTALENGRIAFLDSDQLNINALSHSKFFASEFCTHFQIHVQLSAIYQFLFIFSSRLWSNTIAISIKVHGLKSLIWPSLMTLRACG